MDSEVLVGLITAGSALVGAAIGAAGAVLVARYQATRRMRHYGTSGFVNAVLTPVSRY
ncbi:hypothetical protein [Streptomyces sp. NBC_00154]|uniref:hypothetical protein n=1 Tax=Streptomyces sp. NBC_00154 TaxID=2975670 RepID=UPI00224E7344|nr:hypothetical protein [Streptomyces sp. NBC_00154]MCX5317271.1 hypothetical protein [Streptomyces sp. NBC_00154]